MTTTARLANLAFEIGIGGAPDLNGRTNKIPNINFQNNQSLGHPHFKTSAARLASQAVVVTMDASDASD